MPSKELSLLCEQIEKQDTDNFGKFYMYISLLNTVTIRNKSFIDTLPKYSKGLAFWREKELKVGDISQEFAQQLNHYARSFDSSSTDNTSWCYKISKASYSIVTAYTRIGKISDLVYIIDQMLIQLNRIHGHQSHNQNIYEYVHFKKEKAILAEFINQISILNHELLETVDSVCNNGLSILAVPAGACSLALSPILAAAGLMSIFSLVPTIIGGGLVAGGFYSSYHYINHLIAQLNSLNNQLEKITKTMEKFETSLDGKNYNRFILAALIPLPYAVLTAGEQLLNTCEIKKTRQELDTSTALLSL